MFRNLKLYRLPNGISASPEELVSQLTKFAFKPCGNSDISSFGWVEPHHDLGLVYAQNGQRLICYQSEDKILPSSYVARVAQARAEQIEAEQGRKVGRKEMRDLKEDTITALLPRAFTRLSRTFAWIDNVNGWLGIDASSENRCDDVIAHFTRSLDMIPQIQLPRMQIPATTRMAEWLSTGEAPDGFSIDRDCELRDATADHGAVRYSRTSLDTEEVRNQIGAGKIPTRIGLTWNDRISFVLTHKLEIKRIAVLDILKEQAEQNAENAEDLFASDFSIATGELAKLIADVVEACGGEMPDIDSMDERMAT